MEITGKIVTYAGTDFFYIEEDARSCGIRVRKEGHGITPGMRVDVAGAMQTNADMERYLAATEVTGNGQGSVRPVAMSGKSIGGSDWHYDAASGAGQKGISAADGLSNIGLWVKTTGKVMQGAPGDTEPLYLDDGSGVHVEVVLPSNVTSPGCGALVAVTGVVSCRKEHQLINGPHPPHVYQDFQRRVVLATDLQVLRSAPTWKYSGEMVYVPSGTFLMGDSGIGDDLWAEGFPDWFRDEQPQHSVYLSGYWIGKHEVTRGEYREFIHARGYYNPDYWTREAWEWRVLEDRTKPDFWSPEQDWGTGTFIQSARHPVVGVYYQEAEAFCKWAGGHLTTEAQFEKAARWDGTPRVYPWGNHRGVDMCNDICDSLYTGFQTSPVESYPQGISPYGCYDMVGNVWEWVTGWHDFDSYAKVPAGGWLDPQGTPHPVDGRKSRPNHGGVFRFGWNDSRCASRFYSWEGKSGDRPQDVGFRIAR